MKEMNIKEFAKENKYMTQMSKDVDMDAALSALATLSANVEAISESDELKELVHSIPVGYSVYNPVVKFTKRAQGGKYDNLTDEEYQAKLDDVNVIGSVLNEKYRDDFLDVDMRDTYAELINVFDQRYSFHTFTNTSNAIVRNIGFAIGTVILRNEFSSLHPSILAASSSSLGIPIKKVLSKSMLKGICIAM